MDLNRKAIIEAIVEADNLCLEPVDPNKLYKEYAELNDDNLIIELVSTLNLASRQIRFLEHQKKLYYYEK
jgi:hypothetical protein